MNKIKTAIEYAQKHGNTHNDVQVHICSYSHYAIPFIHSELQGRMLERFLEHLKSCDECTGLVDALYAQREAAPLWEKIGERVKRITSVLITPEGISGRPVPAAGVMRGADSGMQQENDFFTSEVDLPGGGRLNITVVSYRNGRQTAAVKYVEETSRAHVYSLWCGERMSKQASSTDGFTFEIPGEAFYLVIDGSCMIPFNSLLSKDGVADD